MTNKSLTIGWLYPDLMSTYGDHGNILALQKRLEWRNIKSEVLSMSLGSKPQDLEKCDLLFMGGAQDKQQEIVARDFTNGKKEMLAKLIESSLPGLYICGAYQFLGNYYEEADGNIIECLGILDLHTVNTKSDRLTGNLIFDPEFCDPIIGFENHGGKTYLGEKCKPFGKIIKGYGNNGEDQTEGAIYKNSYGSYSHGPILPKNPQFADFLLTVSLRRKYGDEIVLDHLEDSLEKQARQSIARSMNVSV